MNDTYDDLRAKVAHTLEMQFGQFLAHDPYKPEVFYGQAADSLIHLMTTNDACWKSPEQVERVEENGGPQAPYTHLEDLNAGPSVDDTGRPRRTPVHPVHVVSTNI